MSLQFIHNKRNARRASGGGADGHMKGESPGFTAEIAAPTPRIVGPAVDVAGRGDTELVCIPASGIAGEEVATGRINNHWS
jgi:hypothetical protein